MGTKAAQAPILNPFKLKPTKNHTQNDTVAISQILFRNAGAENQNFLLLHCCHGWWDQIVQS